MFHSSTIFLQFVPIFVLQSGYRGYPGGLERSSEIKPIVPKLPGVRIKHGVKLEDLGRFAFVGVKDRYILFGCIYRNYKTFCS